MSVSIALLVTGLVCLLAAIVTAVAAGFPYDTSPRLGFAAGALFVVALGFVLVGTWWGVS